MVLCVDCRAGTASGTTECQGLTDAATSLARNTAGNGFLLWNRGVCTVSGGLPSGRWHGVLPTWCDNGRRPGWRLRRHGTSRWSLPKLLPAIPVDQPLRARISADRQSRRHLGVGIGKPDFDAQSLEIPYRIRADEGRAWPESGR